MRERMSFKELLQQDVKGVFLDPAEFRETHTVNGKEMTVIIDSNEQIEREKRGAQQTDGVYMNQKLIYVAAEDLGPLPAQGSLFTLDKRRYRVADAISEDGVYSITVEANRS